MMGPPEISHTIPHDNRRGFHFVSPVGGSTHFRQNMQDVVTATQHLFQDGLQVAPLLANLPQHCCELAHFSLDEGRHEGLGLDGNK